MEIAHAQEGGMPAGAALPLPPLQGSAGTVTSLVLRIISLVAGALSVFSMASAGNDAQGNSDYSTVPGFSFLIGAATVQSVWALGMATMDIDLLLLTKGRPNHWFIDEAIKLIDSVVGGTLFCGASAACGFYLFVHYDLRECPTEHCGAFESAISRAYMAFAAIAVSCLANWLGSLRTSDQAVKIRWEWETFVLWLTVSFAIPSIGMGLILNCNVPNMDHPCTPSMASELLLLALILQISEGMLELLGYLLAGLLAPMNPGPKPDWPLTWFLYVAVKSAMSVFTLGTGCATLGLQHALFINDVYEKSTNILNAMFCLASIITGVLSVLSSAFSIHGFASRYLRRDPVQQ